MILSIVNLFVDNQRKKKEFEVKNISDWDTVCTIASLKLRKFVVFVFIGCYSKMMIQIKKVGHYYQ